MKHQKRIKKASVVLSAAVLTAVSLSSNLFGIQRSNLNITAEARSQGLRGLPYTYNKSYDNPVTGKKKFTITNSAIGTFEDDGTIISLDSDYYLYDPSRHIVFLSPDKKDDFFATIEQLSMNEFGLLPNQLDPSNETHQSLFNFLRSQNQYPELYTFAYTRTPSQKWGDEQVGAMYQFEQVYDYFKNTHFFTLPCDLVITDTAAPAGASSYNTINMIEFCKKSNKSENAAKEIGIIAHEYMHRILNYKLLWSYDDIGMNDKGKCYGEGGALNEAYADIMGQYAEGAITGSKNWVIGDVLYANGKSDRDMTLNITYTSNLDGKKYKHYYKLDAVKDVNKMEAHEGATIIDHVAYYMDKNGIEPQYGEEIWFQSLQYLKQNLKHGGKYDFKSCRNAVSIAAQYVLYGSRNIDQIGATKRMMKVYSAFNFGKIFSNDNYKMGDVNNDGTVDIKDVIYVGRLASDDTMWDFTPGQGMYKADQYAKGDVNYDGEITQADYNLLAKALQNHTEDKL